ncbi:MAG TPA: hypothetical protein VH083_23360 [Myxococcales bacterium]|nr:hypothetical protein [Myxococcales bacterium]
MDVEQALDPRETLFVANRRRFMPVYGANEAGARELTLYCGAKEVSFDEPELFPWAEKLIQQDSFLAGAAIDWSGQPLEWPRVKDLLESLIDFGVLAREPPQAVAAQPGLSARHLEFLATDEKRTAVDGPRSWNPDAGAVLQEIAGRGIDPAYIECVLPVYRLAHIAVDREGRQVGEINVFPDALRLKGIPTEWKVCNYAGGRYRDPMAMNMSALRSMLDHWKPVLRAIVLFREEFLTRYPRLPDGRWRLGEVHFVSAGVLALVSLQTMRFRDPVRNGDLDPVLSSLFRVVDGVRMIAGHLLDLPEQPMVYDTPVGPKEITGAAEREGLYRSGRGVCAGPPQMIVELVETLLNGGIGGKATEQQVQLGPWVEDIPLALDYGLRGLQLTATLQTIWMRMGLAYTRIRETLARAGAPSRGRLGKLHELIERDWPGIVSGRKHLPEQQSFSKLYFQRMFRHAQTGIRGLLPEDRRELTDLLTPAAGTAAALRQVFVSAEEPELASAHEQPLREIADHVHDYLGLEAAGLRVMTNVQREINQLLGRPQPKSPLTGSQLAIFYLLRRQSPGVTSHYLLDTVQEALGLETLSSTEPGRR